MASKTPTPGADHGPPSTPRLLKPAEKHKLICKKKRDAPNKWAYLKRKDTYEIGSTSLEDRICALQLHDSEVDGNRAASSAKAFLY